MSKLFNKTFFRFVLGFLAILIVSFTIILVTDFYDKKFDLSEATAPRSK